MQFARWQSVLVAAIWVVGCAALKQDWAPEIESSASPVWTADGMYLVQGHAGALFLTPSPLDLENYRGAVLEEIKISAKDGSRALKPSEEERLRGYISRRLAHVFECSGLPIVDDAGADVLRVRLSVKEVEIRKLHHSHHGNIVTGVSRGKISIVLEVREPASNERRLLFGDSRRLPFGVYSGTDAVSIRRVEDAFYEFSIDMRRRLEQVQRGEFPPPPRSGGTTST